MVIEGYETRNLVDMELYWIQVGTCLFARFLIVYHSICHTLIHQRHKLIIESH